MDRLAGPGRVGPDARQRRLMETARFMQLVYQQEEDVCFADTAKATRHLSQMPAKTAGDVAVEVQHGQQLAQPAGGDPGTMDRLDVAGLDPRQHARQPVEPGVQQVVTGW
jgi:hypothetical protein